MTTKFIVQQSQKFPEYMYCGIVFYSSNAFEFLPAGLLQMLHAQ